MNRRTHAVALTLVMAAALCADRVAVAAPQLRPQVGSVASRVMERLTLSLRRVVPTVTVVESRCEGLAVQARLVAPEPVHPVRRPLSPCEFRLPPPTA